MLQPGLNGYFLQLWIALLLLREGITGLSEMSEHWHGKVSSDNLSSFDASLPPNSWFANQNVPYQIGSIEKNEFYALEAFYNELDGENWRWKVSDTYHVGIPWNFTGGYGIKDPCTDDWQGIICDCRNATSCRIVELNLADTNLHGSFPSCIGNFTELTLLSMMSNYITGSLPEELYQLQNLYEINFSAIN